MTRNFYLSLNVVGDGPDERDLVESEDPNDVINAIYETADEVDNDDDKYYELHTPYPDNWDYTFTGSEGILDYMMRNWICEEGI